MNFCKFCDKFLKIREELNIETNQRTIFYWCGECKYKQAATNYEIDKRIYRRKTINNKKENNPSQIILNRSKANDITLPSKITTCKYCKKTNLNKFVNKYYKSHFYVENICSNCFFSF